MSFFKRSALSVPQITTINDSLSADNVPRVSVWVGATSGIGLATLKRFVSRGQAITVYLVGRDASRQQPLIDSLCASNKSANIFFIEGQVSLLRDVQRICDEIAGRVDNIDALFLSAGFLPMTGRKETEEGLEMCMAVTYYSKISFMKLLMPLLKKSEHPRIVAIVSAGFETSDVQLDDITFEKPGRFGAMALAHHGASYLTLAMDHIARSEPRVTMIHAHPGSVDTGILTTDKALGARVNRHVLKWVVEPLITLTAFTPEQSGERSLYLLTNSAYGGWGTPLLENHGQGVNIDGGADGGAVFLVDMQMNSIRQEKVLKELRDKKADQVIWDHTMEVLKKYSSSLDA